MALKCNTRVIKVLAESVYHPMHQWTLTALYNGKSKTTQNAFFPPLAVILTYERPNFTNNFPQNWILKGNWSNSDRYIEHVLWGNMLPVSGWSPWLAFGLISNFERYSCLTPWTYAAFTWSF